MPTQPSSDSSTSSYPLFYCNQCTNTYSLENFLPKIQDFFKTLKALQKNTISIDSSFADGRKHLHQCTYLMILCDEFIPVNHYAHQYVTSLLSQAYWTLFQLSSFSANMIKSSAEDRVMLHQKWMETVILDLQERTCLYTSIHPMTIFAIIEFIRDNLTLLREDIVKFLRKESRPSAELRNFSQYIIKWSRQLISYRPHFLMDVIRCYGHEHEHLTEMQILFQEIHALEELFQRLYCK